MNQTTVALDVQQIMLSDVSFRSAIEFSERFPEFMVERMGKLASTGAT